MDSLDAQRVINLANSLGREAIEDDPAAFITAVMEDLVPNGPAKVVGAIIDRLGAKNIALLLLARASELAMEEEKSGV